MYPLTSRPIIKSSISLCGQCVHYKGVREKRNPPGMVFARCINRFGRHTTIALPTVPACLQNKQATAAFDAAAVCFVNQSVSCYNKSDPRIFTVRLPKGKT